MPDSCSESDRRQEKHPRRSNRPEKLFFSVLFSTVNRTNSDKSKVSAWTWCGQKQREKSFYLFILCHLIEGRVNLTVCPETLSPLWPMIIVIQQFTLSVYHQWLSFSVVKWTARLSHTFSGIRSHWDPFRLNSTLHDEHARCGHGWTHECICLFALAPWWTRQARPHTTFSKISGLENGWMLCLEIQLFLASFLK